MYTDPGITSHDFLDENLDSSNLPNLDSSVGPPREPRWNGKKLPLTPARDRAVAEKQVWQQRRAELGAIAYELPELAQVELVSPHAVGLAVDAGRDVSLLALRLLARIAAVALCGFGACAVSVVELGRAVGASEKRTRSALQALVERAWLEVVPTFERHGAASSRRANAYVVPARVLDQLGGITCGGITCERACPADFGTASGTDSPAGGVSCETPPSISSLMPCRLAGAAPAAPAAGDVSASRTVDFTAAVPAVGVDEPLPGKRQGESCDVVGGAPQAVSREQQMLAALRETRDAGNSWSREWLAERARKEMLERTYGKPRHEPERVTPELAQQRAKAISTHGVYVVGDDLDLDGGAS